LKRLIQYSILLVLAVALTTGILWARDKSRGELCSRVDVEVVNADSTSFVTPQGVINDLKGQGIKLVGKHMGDIDASDIEEALKLSPYLENADIVKCQDGRLLIRVNQLVPVLRVFDGDNSYYVNRVGKRMEANLYYHCDVPVVKGHFTKRYPETRLLPLINYVEGDSLLRSLVTMYYVRDTNNIIIVPQISGHVINIGDASGFENKFAKLKLFYNQVLPKKGWNTYDTISVKWNHQVVATRRVKAVEQHPDYDPLEDEQPPDLQTMTLGSKAEANRNEQQQAQASKTDADKKKAQADGGTKKEDAKKSEQENKNNKKKS
jgi:cell division protein FtsQ